MTKYNYNGKFTLEIKFNTEWPEDTSVNEVRKHYQKMGDDIMDVLLDACDENGVVGVQMVSQSLWRDDWGEIEIDDEIYGEDVENAEN